MARQGWDAVVSLSVTPREAEMLRTLKCLTARSTVSDVLRLALKNLAVLQAPRQVDAALFRRRWGAR